MATGSAILSSLRSDVDIHDYRKLHWEGSFEDYLNIVIDRPEATRTAYQRLYDMILAHGTEDLYENKEKFTVYKFFIDFAARHGDGIFGIDRTLSQLVNTFKSHRWLRAFCISLALKGSTDSICRADNRW